MLQNLNESIKNLGGRFDTYQRQVDDKFLKISAEMTLLKNRVDMVESQNRIKSSNPIATPQQNIVIEMPKP